MAGLRPPVATDGSGEASAEQASPGVKPAAAPVAPPAARNLPERALDPVEGDPALWEAFDDEGGLHFISRFHALEPVTLVGVRYGDDGKPAHKRMRVPMRAAPPRLVRETLSAVCRIPGERWENQSAPGVRMETGHGELCEAFTMERRSGDWSICHRTAAEAEFDVDCYLD